MGVQQWTYRQLDAESNRLVDQLKSFGVVRGDIVAISFSRGFEQISSLLALLKMGVAYLPLDADYPTDRLRYMLAQSQTKLLLTQKKYVSLFSDLNIHIATIETVKKTNFVHENLATELQISAVKPFSLFAAENRQVLPKDWSQIIYVLYTSGSTGKPKGIAMGEAALENMISLQNEQTKMGRNSVTLQFSPLGFDVHFQEIFSTWSMGGELVLISEEDKRNPTFLLKLIEQKKINRIHMPYVALKSLCETANRLNVYPQSIREITAGGEQLKINNTLRTFFAKIPNCVLFNQYGPTETHLATTNRLGSLAEGHDPELWPDLPSIGYPVGNYKLLILDEKMQPLAVGETGELYIGGVCVAYGYLHAPELTAERFLQHKEFGLIYKTGDLCKYNSDGQITFYGRMDSQVKVRGYRVEISEVETAVNKCVGVTQCMVKLHTDDNGAVLCAYILAQNNFNIEFVKNEISMSLPEYMVPSLYVLIDKLPVTPSGKLDYKSLPSPFAQRPILSVEFVACSTVIEKQIENIWKRYLQIEKVGLYDSFFDLGGHSLLLVKVLLDLNETFHSSLGTSTDSALSLADLFTALNISQLAELISAKSEKQKKIQFVENEKKIHSVSEALSSKISNHDIAVIAINGRFPQVENMDQFWQLLVENKNAIGKFPADKTHPSVLSEDVNNKNYVFASGELKDADSFDFNFFGINKQEAESVDPQQRKFLELSYETFEMAGYNTVQMKNNRIGVFASMGPSKYSQIVSMYPDKARSLGEHYLQMGLDKDYLATKIAYKLNLKGPALNVNTACSSSLVSVINAVESLRSGFCDMALAGGVSIRSTPLSGHLFNEGGILSSSEQCRPFDQNADGTIFTDGIGMVLLKRLDQAQRDGDFIWAVIKGVGLNNDGADKMNYMAPSLEGQAQVISQALADADVSAESISYVEAHGTATPVGDPIEFAALKKVYERYGDKKNYCVLSSVKSNIGHANSAAGIAGFIKAVLSLHKGIIPGTVHFKNVNANIDLKNSPFIITNENRPFVYNMTQENNDKAKSGENNTEELNDKKTNLKTSQSIRAAVSSFGVGGTNAHVILEKFENPPKIACAQMPTSIFRFSSKSETHFSLLKPVWMDYFSKSLPGDWQRIAYSLHIGRVLYQKRAAMVVSSDKKHIEWLPKENTRESFRNAKLIFVFPGQGSQYIGMGKNLYESVPLFRTIFDQLIDKAQGFTELNIRKIFFSNQQSIQDLEIAQPMLFIFEFALAKFLFTLGYKTDAFIGHSLGEFTAAALAGVFEFTDVFRLLEYRAKLIKTLPTGQMLSVALTKVELVDLIGNDKLDIAAENSSRSVVVSGADSEIEKLKQILNSKNIVFLQINSTHAFHSRMMQELKKPLLEFLNSINLQDPESKIYSTIEPKSSNFSLREYWAEHLLKPVEFKLCIESLLLENSLENEGSSAQPIVFLEVGPKRGLSQLIKKITNSAQIESPTAKHNNNILSISMLSDQAQEENWFMYKAIAELWVHGVDSKDPEQFYAFDDRHRMPVATTVFEKNMISLPWKINGQSTVFDMNEKQREDAEMQIPANQQKITIIDELASMFGNATGLSIGRSESDTSFFNMGMDSLFLTQIALLINRKWNVNISFRMLMEKITTMSLLADYLIENCEIKTVKSSDHQNRIVNDSQNSFSPDHNSLQIKEPVIQGKQSSINNSRSRHSVLSNTMNHNISSVVSEQSHSQSSQLTNLFNQQLEVMREQLALMQNISNVQIKNNFSENENDNINHVIIEKNEKQPPVQTFGAGARITLKKSLTLNDEQRRKISSFAREYNQQTRQSKLFTEKSRSQHADPRAVTGFRPETKEFVYPVVVEKSLNQYLWDLDGNRYVDMTCGFGSNFFGNGHSRIKKAIQDQLENGIEIGPQHPLTAKVSELMCEMTGHDRVAFCNTGSEAVVGALRIARTISGKNKVVIFSGSYHGIADEMIVRAQAQGISFPAAAGIPPEAVAQVKVLDYGTEESLKYILENANDIAAVLVEPVQSRRSSFQPHEFIKSLRLLTKEKDICLIFDEIITGFRIHAKGAQGFFNIQADVCTYGKIVGGGMPIGMIAGQKKYMDALDGGSWQYGDQSSPQVGVTYFAGTFVRHPLALAASKAALEVLQEGGQEMIDDLNLKAKKFIDQCNIMFDEYDFPMTMDSCGSLMKPRWTSELPASELFFAALRFYGVHTYDGFPWFVNLAHTSLDLNEVLKSLCQAILMMQDLGLFQSKQVISSDKVKSEIFDAEKPPLSNARLGKDKDGNPAWFVENEKGSGRYSIV